MRTKTRFNPLAILALTLCVACGCGRSSDKDQPAKDQQPSREASDGPSQPDPITGDVADDGETGGARDVPADDSSDPVTASDPTKRLVELQQAWKNDPTEMQIRLADKQITVAGYVASLTQEQTTTGEDVWTIAISPTQDGYSTTLRGQLTDPKPWKKLSPGAWVEMRGVWPVAIASDPNEVEPRLPTLLDTTLLDVRGDAYTDVSAATLARAFDRDVKQAAKEYAGKHLVVHGEVDAFVQEVEFSFYMIQMLMKGTSKSNVAVHYGLLADQQFSKLSVGQEITILGLCEVPEQPNEDLPVGIVYAQVLEEK